MASGVELATAYVSLVGETSKLKKDINAAFVEADKSSARAGKKIGENLSSGLGGTKNSAAKAGKDAAAEYERALKSSIRGERIGEMIGKPIGKGIGLAIKGGIGIAAVGATAAVGTLVTSLTKGFTRLKNIDNAKFQLEALGNSAADVKKIMDNATKAVKGTAFGLDAAATTAATAVAAGVAPGTDLTAYLTNVADAAAIAQTSLEEMGSIFNKVQTNGSAMTDDLQMLADRGLPIFTWLQRQYGVTGDALKKMVEDGKVSSADFNRAISENLGGAAQKMGQSFEGSLQNLDAALGRIGATILGVPFDHASGGIGSITGALDKLNGWLSENQNMMVDFWAGLAKGAVTGAQGILETLGHIILGFAQMQNAVGDILGGISKAQAWSIEFLGGDPDEAKKWYDRAEGFFAWGTSAAKTSDELFALANRLESGKDGVDAWAERAKNAATLTKAFGDAVAKVDDNQILITDNTPEVTKNLEDLGIKLETLPSGEVRLVPNTPEAQKLIDAFLGKNNPTPPIPVPVAPGVEAADQVMSDFIARWSQAIITPSIAPGSGIPGQNPLGIMGGGSGLPASPNPLDVFAGSNPNNADTHGKLTPETANVQTYLRETLGFKGTIGGYRQPDGYNEHSSGKASDVMISSKAEGYGLLPNVLTRPGVQYVIWDNKMWYPDGTQKPYTGPNPHTDHLHVKTYASGGGVAGPGGPKSDVIPAWLSNGEHVLTAEDVAALGGQNGVYAFRDALHRKNGGAISRELFKLGSSGGGWAPFGEGDGADYGERTEKGRPRDPQWGDWTPGIIGGDRNVPNGPWKDYGTIAPWWFWGDQVISSEWGNQSGLKPRSPEWWNRRDVIIGPNEGNDRQRRPGAYDPEVKIPPHIPAPEDGAMWPLPPPEQALGFSIGRYDSGGPWPSGTLGLNTTGKDEWVLTPEQLEELRKQGIDPATIEHGQGGAGYRPGPTDEQLAQLTPQGGDGAELMGGNRTEGYIPAAAGSTAVAGESFLSGVYGMGAEVIKGVIDQAASAASTAVAAGITAGTFGAGAAGGGQAGAAAAQFAIGMGTQAAKRGVDYGAQMLGILTDATIEQLTPFGAPRLLTTDATGFMPQEMLMKAATTSLEKAFQPQKPEGPEQPDQLSTAGAANQVSELQPAPEAGPQFNTTVNATVKDVAELDRTLANRRMLDSMQYRGRPGP